MYIVEVINHVSQDEQDSILASKNRKSQILEVVNDIIESNVEEMKTYRDESIKYAFKTSSNYIVLFDTGLCILLINNKMQLLALISEEYLNENISLDLSSYIFPKVYLTVFNKIIDLNNMVVYSDEDQVKQIAYELLCIRSNIGGTYSSLPYSYNKIYYSNNTVDVIDSQ